MVPNLTWKLVKVMAHTKEDISGFSSTDIIASLAYSTTGHLLYNDQKGLWAVPFSADEKIIRGEPFLLDPGGLSPSLSQTGTLVFTKNVRAGEQLIVVDRAGAVTRFRPAETAAQLHGLFHTGKVPFAHGIAAERIYAANDSLTDLVITSRRSVDATAIALATGPGEDRQPGLGDSQAQANDKPGQAS